MTTFATSNGERLRAELDARVRVAWSSYSGELASLEGRAYEDAERAAWEQLQAALDAIEAERGELERVREA